MADAPSATGSSDSNAQIDKMSAAFDKATAMAAKITEIKTEKGAELDAAKQRPNN